MNISEIIHAQLAKFNAANFITVGKQRHGRAMERVQNNLNKVQITFDGKELSDEEKNAIRAGYRPNCFKKSPVTYLATASDGSAFEMEVSEMPDAKQKPNGLWSSLDGTMALEISD